MQTPYNPISGTVYQGKNIPSLLSSGYESKEWATFIQWKKEGYKVKKGSKASYILTFAEVEKKTKNGKVTTGHAPRSYAVFNREQVTKI